MKKNLVAKEGYNHVDEANYVILLTFIIAQLGGETGVENRKLLHQFVTPLLLPGRDAWSHLHRRYLHRPFLWW